jgi:hypothetical protein
VNIFLHQTQIACQKVVAFFYNKFCVLITQLVYVNWARWITADTCSISVSKSCIAEMKPAEITGLLEKDKKLCTEFNGT